MKLERGAKVWIQMGKRKEAGIILDFTDNRGNCDGWQCKIELLVVNPLVLGGQLLRQVFPHPIQSSQLTKRYETLPGEVQDESH